jgi:hypothetical protein
VTRADSRLAKDGISSNAPHANSNPVNFPLLDDDLGGLLFQPLLYLFSSFVPLVCYFCL